LQRSPDDQEPLFRLAELETDLQRYDEALIYFSRAINLLPGEPLAYLLRSRLYHRLGQDNLAENDARTAVMLRRQRAR